MPNQHPGQPDEADGGLSNPLQFRLIDLFAGLTLCALVMAMAVPLLRGIRTEDHLALVTVLCAQAIVITGAILGTANKRKKLLSISGRRISVGYCGQVKWRHWPVARSLGTMLLIANAQVGLAVAMTANLKMALMSPGFFAWVFQLGLFAISPISIFLLGMGLSYLGFGPLSRRKNSSGGFVLAAIGFLCRLAGLLLLLWTGCLLLFIISMTRPPV